MDDLIKGRIKESLRSPELPEIKKEIEVLLNDLQTNFENFACVLYKLFKDDINKSCVQIRFKKNPNAQRFFINIGSYDGVTVTTLMELIMGALDGVTKDDFSDVYVREKYSFFELPKERTDDVLTKVTGLQINNRDVRVEQSSIRQKK